jgi:competence protein ComEA
MRADRCLRALLGACCLGLLCAAVAPAAGAVAAPASESATVSTTPIDVNQASEEELALVPGIGKVMARRIIEFREQNGPFARVEDLLKVKGIGEKSLEKLRPHVKVSRRA